MTLWPVHFREMSLNDQEPSTTHACQDRGLQDARVWLCRLFAAPGYLVHGHWNLQWEKVHPGRTDGSICHSQKGATWKLGCWEGEKNTTGFHTLVKGSRGLVMKTGKKRKEQGDDQ